MIAFSAPSVNPQPNSSILQPRTLSMTIDTDIPIGSFTAGYRFQFRPVLWIASADLPEVATSPPSEAFWDFTTAPSTLLATVYALPWVGTGNANNQRNGRLLLTFANNAGSLRLVLQWEFINVSDTITFLTGTHVNQLKYQQDSVFNPNTLDNGYPDTYTTNRAARMAVYAFDPTDNTRALGRIETVELNRFWNEAPNWDNAEFTTTNCAGGQQINPTAFNVTFSAQLISGSVPASAYWGIIRTDTADDSLYWLNNSELFAANFTPAPLAPSPFAATHDLSNANGGFLSATAFAQAGPNYETTAQVNPAVLAVGATYRFFVLVRDSAATPNHFSWLSDEYTISNCACVAPPQLTQAVINDGVNSINILLGQETVPLRVACQRLQSVFEMSFAALLASLGKTDLRPFLRRIYVRFYAKYAPNPNIYNVLEEYTIVPNFAGLWVAPPSNPSNYPTQWTLNVSANSVLIEHDFKVRDNPDETNIRSVNNISGLPLPSPVGSQDWVNKDIYIEYNLLLQDNDYIIPIQHTRKLEVAPFATIDQSLATPNSMNWSVNGQLLSADTIELCNSDDSTDQICSGAEYFEDIGVPHRYSSALDVKPLNGNKYIEDNGAACPPLLDIPTLQSPAVTTQDCDYTGGDACTEIQLPADPSQVFYAIKQSYSPSIVGCCSDPDALNVIAAMNFGNRGDGVYNPVLPWLNPTEITARQAAICQLVQDLKACGVWTKLRRLNVLAAHNLAATSINWLNPGTNDATYINFTPANFHMDTGVGRAPGGPVYISNNFTYNEMAPFGHNAMMGLYSTSPQLPTVAPPRAAGAPGFDFIWFGGGGQIVGEPGVQDDFWLTRRWYQPWGNGRHPVSNTDFAPNADETGYKAIQRNGATLNHVLNSVFTTDAPTDPYGNPFVPSSFNIDCNANVPIIYFGFQSRAFAPWDEYSPSLTVARPPAPVLPYASLPNPASLGGCSPTANIFDGSNPHNAAILFAGQNLTAFEHACMRQAFKEYLCAVMPTTATWQFNGSPYSPKTEIGC